MTRSSAITSRSETFFAAGFYHRQLPFLRILAIALGLTGLVGISVLKAAPNTLATVNTGATDLTVGTSFSSSPTEPTSTYDVEFQNSSYTSTAFTDGVGSAGTISFGSLDDINTSQSLSVTAGVTGSTLTLGTNANGIGNASDAIYVANGANLTLGTTANSFLGVTVGTTGDNLDVVGTGTLTLDATLNYGAININKTGTGTLVLGTNGKLTSTSAGNLFTLSAGTLILGQNSAFSFGNLVITGGAIDDSTNLSGINGEEQVDIGGTSASTGSVSFTFGNSHQFVLTGTHTPSTVFLDKTTTISLAGANNNSNTDLVSTENAFTTATAGAQTIEVDEASGTTGATLTIGTFKLQSNTAAGTNTNINEIFQGNGNILINGAVTDGVATNGTRGITYAGTGTLTLSSTSSTYDGGTNITGGTVSISADANLGAVPGSATVGNVIIDNTAGNGATLATTANLTISSNRGISLGSSTASTGGTLAPATGTTLTYGGILANNGGTNSLTINGLGTVDLTGANTYSGITTVSAGTLEFGNAGALYSGNTTNWTASNLVVASGGTLVFAVGASPQFTTGNVTTLLTNLDGTVSNDGLENGSAIGFDTTSASGGTFTISNVIANTTGTGGGTVGLTKLGTGTLLLTNTNTYSGTTTVSAGTLAANAAGAITNSPIIVNGGTLTENTTNALTGSDSIAVSSGTVTLSVANNYSGSTTISGTGTLALTSAGAINGSAISYSGGTFTESAVANEITGSSSLTVTAGSLTLSQANNYSGTTTVSGGTLVLSGSNSSAGGTTISGGTLQLNNTASDGGLASGTLTLGGGTLQGTASPVPTITNAVALTASSTISGAKALTFSGTLTNTGASNTLTVNNSAATAITGGNVYLSDSSGSGYTLTIKGSGAVSIGDAIADYNGSGTAGSLTYSGTGTLTLGAANTYSGTTTVSGGTLVLSGSNSSAGGTTISGGTLQLNNTASDGGLASGTLTLGGGTLQGTASPVPTITNAVALTASSTISGAKALTFSGTLTNTGASNTLTVNNSAATAITGGNVYLSDSSGSGYTLTIKGSGAVSIGDAIADYNGSGTAGSLTYSGTGTLTLGAANTYSGTTTVSSGTLALTNSLALQDSTLATGGGHVTLSGITTATIGGLTGSTNLGTMINSGYSNLTALTLNPQSGISDSYSGAIADGHAGMTLSKTGSGTQTLTVTNTYTGATLVSSGTLQVGASGGTTGTLANTSGVTINTGGTLLFANTSGNSINNSATVALGGGTLSVARVSGSAGTLGISETMGALTLTAGSVIDFGSPTSSVDHNTLTFSNLTNTTGVAISVDDWIGTATFPPVDSGSNDQLLFGSSATLANLQAEAPDVSFYSDNGSTFVGYGTVISYGSGYEIVAAVPEPSTYFGATCLLGLLGWRGRRRIQELVVLTFVRC